MSKTIQLAASLPASPDLLFDMYLDPALHSAFTGARVNISPTPGALFSAFDGVLSGTILRVVQTQQNVDMPLESVAAIDTDSLERCCATETCI